MFKTIRTFALSAMLGLGAIAGASALSATPAEAGSLYVGGKHGGVQIQIGGGYGYGYGHGYKKHYGHGYKKWGHGHRACSPRKAVRKARHDGMRHARVKYANHRVIAVSGRVWGHYDTFVYANKGWCPRIR